MKKKKKERLDKGGEEVGIRREKKNMRRQRLQEERERERTHHKVQAVPPVDQHAKYSHEEHVSWWLMHMTLNHGQHNTGN